MELAIPIPLYIDNVTYRYRAMAKKKAMKAKKETKTASVTKARKAKDATKEDKDTDKRTFTRRELAQLITDAMFRNLWQTPQQRSWEDCVYEGDFITDVIFDESS